MSASPSRADTHALAVELAALIGQQAVARSSMPARPRPFSTCPRHGYSRRLAQGASRMFALAAMSASSATNCLPGRIAGRPVRAGAGTGHESASCRTMVAGMRAGVSALRRSCFSISTAMSLGLASIACGSDIELCLSDKT